MKKKVLPKFKIIWEQVFPEDAAMRIQRAFEMLLTTIDRPSSKTDNEIDAGEIKQTAHSPGNSREATTLSTVDFAILESRKAKRSQNGRRKNFPMEDFGRRN